ncbi:TIR domain-containing protein [Methylotenera sp. 1P/1]|uniref:TIR domain-containing protein n=1 Tax=Methylotenera sp. 1P/1 TaxID=1131551 RepID=UPI000363C681|nr:TIR domain-containing protein [Methylotenera sp. 1P/1]
MALFTEGTIRQRAKVEIAKSSVTKKAAEIIMEENASLKLTTYDIFLSHSFHDAELILGMKGVLEDLGYTIYVDWIEDPFLDRTKVSSKTAEILRQRMNFCKSLFYVTTTNSENSKWMPWECGYFDGKKEKVAIVPVLKESSSNSYSGQEYLGLYPYIVKQSSNTNKELLWTRLDNNNYVSYDTWVSTSNSKIVWKQD